MNIAVTFTDTGGTNVPDGSVLVFENVSSWDVQTPADIERIDCADCGCEGCNAAHHKFTGTAHLKLDASGSREGGPLWKIPEAV